jgi:hypothetical protein
LRAVRCFFRHRFFFLSDLWLLNEILGED